MGVQGFKSHTSRLLFNSLFRITKKKTSGLHIANPFCWESIGNWRIPRAKKNLGPVSIYRCRLSSIRIPMLMIRRSRNRLIFNMGIPIPGKDGLYIEAGPSDMEVCLSKQRDDLQNLEILSLLVKSTTKRRICLPAIIEGVSAFTVSGALTQSCPNNPDVKYLLVAISVLVQWPVAPENGKCLFIYLLP